MDYEYALLPFSFEYRGRTGFDPLDKNCFDKNWHLS